MSRGGKRMKEEIGERKKKGHQRSSSGTATKPEGSFCRRPQHLVEEQVDSNRTSAQQRAAKSTNTPNEEPETQCRIPPMQHSSNIETAHLSRSAYSAAVLT
ncbi:hypothetical protein CesoFtcFv8_017723 [Champsocephalus esox]|uniref:Uncharacterized protein n=1 Tax=Champsocephalus esox TaxID=159716 RepID=A0AAN8GQI8_9TELE|nr:hypothetical protein CesoFtcFv8_017723 [Champsocephalus esox]